jgi:hypothetical protein
MCDLKPKCRNAKSKSRPPPRSYTHTLQTSINYTIQQPDGYKDTTTTNMTSSAPPRASWFGRWVETGEMEPGEGRGGRRERERGTYYYYIITLYIRHRRRIRRSRGGEMWAPCWASGRFGASQDAPPIVESAVCASKRQ